MPLRKSWKYSTFIDWCVHLRQLTQISSRNVPKSLITFSQVM